MKAVAIFSWYRFTHQYYKELKLVLGCDNEP